MSRIRDKWDDRYRNKAAIPPRTPEFVQSTVSQLRPGSVLDIAAGDGASALYLAVEGFDVTAADISAQGLERLQNFAADKGLHVRTEVVDLERPGSISGLGCFDNIVMTQYKPTADFWPQVADHLVAGGILLISTYNLEHHHQTGFSQRFCLAPDELDGIHPSLALVSKSTSSHDNHWMDHYLFRRV